MNNKNLNYRPDIDGLRAIAVLFVLGFHLFPEILPGGFIGVDIFFVISGYLINTILVSSLIKHNFSFIDFYSRRIRRIFPALILILLVGYMLGWLILLPSEFEQLGEHILGGAGFAENFILWQQWGYFDHAAEVKPYLHLWSLGIEEQFYIIWPIFLWLAYRYKLNLFWSIAVIALISFGLNIKIIQNYPIAAFYAPPTRFWEILLGALLAFKYQIPKIHILKLARPQNEVIAMLGLGMILVGVFSINRTVTFPGWWALLPTLGSVCLIAAGPSAVINRALLSNFILVQLGKISYPLYLWHWLLLSFSRIMEGAYLSLSVRITIALVSLLLSILTYVLLEKPIRFGAYQRKKTLALIVLMILTAAMGATTYVNHGFPFRQVVQLNERQDMGDDGKDLGLSMQKCGIESEFTSKLFMNCKQDSRGIPSYALLGDSKAAALYDGLIRTSSPKGYWLFIGGAGPVQGEEYFSAPVPIISDALIYKKYQHLIRTAVAEISQNPNIKVVALVTATRELFQLGSTDSVSALPQTKNYSLALAGLTNVVTALVKAGKEVVIVVDNPSLAAPEDCLSRRSSSDLINSLFPQKENPRCSITLVEHMRLTRQYEDLLSAVAKQFPTKVKIFNTAQFLCSQDGLCSTTLNGRPLYSYTDHISDYAAGIIGQNLNAFLLKRD